MNFKGTQPSVCTVTSAEDTPNTPPEARVYNAGDAYKPTDLQLRDCITRVNGGQYTLWYVKHVRSFS